ncbi:MAG TPA: HAD-IB family phosphatase [Polyangia bacterium]|nr:HAD-IB family phosphatase [Polyangia bacterium]
MIVVSDFDGTLTIEDVTTLFWDAHLPYDWRRELLPDTYAGKMSPLEMIARGYADVAHPPAALLAEARAHARMRPGLEALAGLCAARGWPFVVVSHGLAFYIQDLLPPGIPFVAFAAAFDGRGWRVSLPPGMQLAPGRDFKTEVVTGLRRQHPGRPTVYLGDGRLDLPAAETCDEVFAVRGSKLAELCPRARPFDRLDEVVAALEVR